VGGLVSVLKDSVWLEGGKSFEEGSLPCVLNSFARDGFVVEGVRDASIWCEPVFDFVLPS